MNMHITDEQLCAYLDDELDAAERAQVEQALARDAALGARLASWGAQDAALQVALQAELDQPLPGAWLRLARQAAQTPPQGRGQTQAPSWWARLIQWLPAPQLAAGFAVAVLVGVVIGKSVLPRLDRNGQLVRLAAVAHRVYSPDKRVPVDVKGSDPTLLTWISKRLGAEVMAPDVFGYRFLGGRLLAGAEEPASQLMYENTAGKRLTIFMRTEGAAGRSTSPECSAYHGVSVCYWYAGGVAYALAGEVPQTELAKLADPAAAQTHAARP